LAGWETFSAAWGWYSANRDNLIPIGGLIGGAVIAWAALRQRVLRSADTTRKQKLTGNDV